ncbi:hypothetical protein IMZ48_09730 [Candidatus Bathyarchaeota archaeon]|nr:hypothetical protein [Candidatus Bathyarchaeota archaeon]
MRGLPRRDPRDFAICGIPRHPTYSLKTLQLESDVAANRTHVTYGERTDYTPEEELRQARPPPRLHDHDPRPEDDIPNGAHHRPRRQGVEHRNIPPRRKGKPTPHLATLPVPR